MLEKNILPQHIRSLSIKELDALAAEIRERIIAVCAAKGGHLASSLGTVELCLALHYVLNTPEDMVVFDVGHQAYAHKLLTGRADRFTTIREYGGLSGFPNIRESEYDAFTVGHASNAVSLALGAACADALLKTPRKIVAVVGDGSLTGGECFEALNHAGHLKADILVVFNHNEMSISPSVGALSHYLSKMQSSPVYNRLRNGIEAALKKSPHIGRFMLPRVRKLEEIAKGLLVPGMFFEELGFRYFGPLDGHNLEQLTENLKNIINLPGPKVLHVVTVKGKGYTPAEQDAESFHSAGRFSVSNGDFCSKAACSYTDVLRSHLTECAGNDSRVVAVTAAMEKGTGLDGFRERFPERFFDVGIAEQHAVSFAGGMSRQGTKPVVAIYSTFLQRAYDQLMQDVALQGFDAVFCLDRAGLVGEDGPTHHGAFDLAYMRTIPGSIVMAPGYREDMEAMLAFAIENKGLYSIRYPKDTVLDIPLRNPLAPGKAEVIEEGKGCALLALGSMLKEAMTAAGQLKKEGLAPLVINARFAKPLDEQLLLRLVEEAPVICVLEEGTISGGFGEAVLEFYRSRGLLDTVWIERCAIPDEFVTLGKRAQLFEQCGLDAGTIARKVRTAMARFAGPA